ncbi:hypothetical protein L1987_87400 [Smallanthus sonchifolius]|nr:hypothetical protein L1987_87400 [Smallanthus sonchifolius]
MISGSLSNNVLFFPGIGNGSQDGKVLQTFQKSFVQVQNLLDQNRLLINEINQNQESKLPTNLTRNVGLIRELNNNVKRVVDLYGDLSTSFTKSMDASSEAESGGGGITRSDAKKRLRSTIVLVPSGRLNSTNSSFTWKTDFYNIDCNFIHKRKDKVFLDLNLPLDITSFECEEDCANDYEDLWDCKHSCIDPYDFDDREDDKA